MLGQAVRFFCPPSKSYASCVPKISYALRLSFRGSFLRSGPNLQAIRQVVSSLTIRPIYHFPIDRPDGQIWPWPVRIWQTEALDFWLRA